MASNTFDDEVMVVECHDGMERHYPWDESILEPAEPGFYELDADGATIENPDYEMHWKVHEPVKH